VKVLDVFTYLSKCYIILEFCDGTLKEELNRCNFRIDKVLKYFEEIIYGMDVLQKNRIIHRDLKFENILVKDNKVKIADFGFAKYLGNQLEVESRRCGSPYTMAPEVYFSH
jgi:serine/threonine protein kinase